MPAQDPLLDGQEQKSEATMCVVWAKDFKFYSTTAVSSIRWLQVVTTELSHYRTDGLLDSLGYTRAAPPFTIRRDGAPIVFIQC